MEPDQTSRSAASDRLLHCLSMSNIKNAMLIWVKIRCGWTDSYKTIVKFILYTIFYNTFNNFICNVESFAVQGSIRVEINAK